MVYSWLVMKKTQKKQQTPKMPPQGVIIGVIVLILCSAAFWLTRNQSLYTPEKKDIQAKIEKTINAFKAEGELVYSSIEDKACTTGAIGWLGKTTQCVFKGAKYYKNNKNALVDLRMTDKRMRELGFTNIDGDALNVERPNIFMYDSKDGLSVRREFFKLDQDSTTTAKDYLATLKDIPLNADEYIYGIFVYAPYWSCSLTSWFEQPCPSPPTTPTRN